MNTEEINYGVNIPKKSMLGNVTTDYHYELPLVQLNIRIKTCLAQDERSFNCQYVLLGKPRLCIAPYSVTCAHCLAF